MAAGYMLLILLLALLVDRQMAQPQTVIKQDPIQFCTWPTPEAAVMTCDVGTVIVISNSYITRLAGPLASCVSLHSSGKPQYSQCQIPAPDNFNAFLSSNCNYTEHCVLSTFPSWPLVATGSTICGNKSDAALQRNFMVINWGCIGYVPSIDPNSTDSDNSTASSYEDVTYNNGAWIIPVCVCLGILVLGGGLTGLLIWRRDLLKKKARELRRLRRERRRQSKQQLAAADGLPPQADGGKADVAGWMEAAPGGGTPLATVAETVHYQSMSEVDGRTFESPPSYSLTAVDERKWPEGPDGFREGCRSAAASSSSSTRHGSAAAASSSARRHGSSATRERGSSSGGGGRSHHRSGGHRKTGSRHRSKGDGSQSEMSDADRERRRRRREQLYKGATRIRKPDELSLSSPSDRSHSDPSGSEAPAAVAASK